MPFQGREESGGACTLLAARPRHALCAHLPQDVERGPVGAETDRCSEGGTSHFQTGVQKQYR